MKVKSGKKKITLVIFCEILKGEKRRNYWRKSRKMNLPVSDEGATTEASGTATHDSDKPEGL